MNPTSTPASIRADLDTYIRDIARIPDTESGFDHQTELFDSGFLDSLGIVSLTTRIEQRYGVVLADEHLFDPRCTTINGIADIITEAMQIRRHPATRRAPTQPRLLETSTIPPLPGRTDRRPTSSPTPPPTSPLS